MSLSRKGQFCWQNYSDYEPLNLRNYNFSEISLSSYFLFTENCFSDFCKSNLKRYFRIPFYFQLEKTFVCLNFA